MMKESLKPTVQILNIFKQVRFIFYTEMDEFIKKFAKQVDTEVDSEYMIEMLKIDKIISEKIILKRAEKIFTLRFFEMRNLESIGNEVKYYIYIYIENENAEMIYYRWLEERYYLRITNREYINNMFPKDYTICRNEIDENKIYEYVREYLKALKVMLAEPDFQKLLYDPDFWVYENPYK